MYIKIFACFFCFLYSEKKIKKSKDINATASIFRPYQSLKIKTIKGQLSEKVKTNLENKYWKACTKESTNIDIEYEIFEFLDFLYIKVQIKVNKKIKNFSIKHPYSKNEDWKHDFKLIEKISQEINYKAQKLANE